MSKLTNHWAVAAILLSGVIGFGVSQSLAAGHNPRIHHALEALHAAEDELRDAPHDFHGHKADALAAVHHAIDELDRIKDW